MGFIVFHDLYTGKPTEILGDENAAKKELGLPYRDSRGHYIGERELDEQDKAGE